MSKFDEQQHIEEFIPDVTDEEREELRDNPVDLYNKRMTTLNEVKSIPIQHQMILKAELLEHLIYLTGKGHKITSIIQQDQPDGYFSIEFEEAQNASSVSSTS